MINIVIITGVSGAGKSLCVQAFEESGYYVTDNVPLGVIEQLFDVFSAKEEKYRNAAVAVNLSIAHEVYTIAKKYKNFNVQFLGLYCDEARLQERFRLSRRLHPLQSKGFTLNEAMKMDYDLIYTLRNEFSFYIDTSNLQANEMRRVIYRNLIGKNGNEFTVSFVSFGYKKAVPQDIETVFDVRILPNPYWDPKLCNLTGKDQEVIDYVLNSDVTKEYLEHVTNYLEYYLEKLQKDGRKHAFIGVACSGGQHRSVVIAEYLSKYFSKKYSTSVSHRDMPK